MRSCFNLTLGDPEDEEEEDEGGVQADLFESLFGEDEEGEED